MRSAAKRSDLPGLMETGLALHQAGRLAEAAQHYEQVLAQDPGNADAHNLLGVSWHQRGDQGRAIPAIAQALTLRPDSATYHVNLGSALAAAGRGVFAIETFRRAIALAPGTALAHRNLGSMLNGGAGAEAARAFARAAVADPSDPLARLGCAHAVKEANPRAAAQSCRDALRLAPMLAEARFLLAALEGDAPPRPPSQYVRGLFNKYAAGFDRDLLDKLGYVTPELLAEMLRERRPEGGKLETVDLGCGTGLGGLAFRDVADPLIGIDLSPAMLEQARARGLYRELIEADIAEALARQPAGRFGLAVASDVLNYLGDLDPVMAALARALKQGGFFACSTEASDRPGYRLHQGLRYAHAADYVIDAAARAGFALAAQRRATLRRQGSDEVAGDLFLFTASSR